MGARESPDLLHQVKGGWDILLICWIHEVIHLHNRAAISLKMRLNHCWGVRACADGWALADLR